VLAPVSAEDDASVHGILELQATITRLAERLRRPPAALLAVLTRWQPLRVSSRRIEQLLIGSDLAPVAKIRSRSAAVAKAAAARVPLVVNAPDSSAAIGYIGLVQRLEGVRER
jgi:hypothetical protein